MGLGALVFILPLSAVIACYRLKLECGQELSPHVTDEKLFSRRLLR